MPAIYPNLARLLAAVLSVGWLLAAAACSQSDAAMPTLAPATNTPATTAAPEPPVEADNETSPTPVPDLPAIANPTADIQASPTPLFTGTLSPSCGLLLPPLPQPPAALSNPSPLISPEAAAPLLNAAPASARAALAYLIDHPDDVGLVAYQLGSAANGVYVNRDAPMPLASLVKLVHLVAYVEAVAAGELDPLEQVPLAEVDRFYLPNFDLGAHRRAVSELEADGRLFGEANPTLLLEEIPWMMIRHSSNAASDYLHARLGQERIEATAQALGLTTQTAPCPFIGQFLTMANHTRQTDDTVALRAYLDAGEDGAAAYGADVALLADAYSQRDAFRTREVAWRRTTRRPTITSQRLFTEQFNPQASAGEYAALMARLAQNGLSTPDSSFQARRYLEWPMVFPSNQELFSNLGYKNGSLPGVLTTAYYAYRWGKGAPIVVILLYRNLPQQTYRQWRFDLPHDELARWLLADPAAIPLLSSAFPAAP